MDGGGHAIAIDANGLVSRNGRRRRRRRRLSPVIFVGPNCSLTIKNAVIEVSSSRGGGTGAKKFSRGKALWPRLVRLAPGGRVSASSRDAVSFASSSGAAVAPSDVDGTKHRGRAQQREEQRARASGGLKPGDRSAVEPLAPGKLTINRDPRRRTRRDRPRLWPAASVHDEASNVVKKRGGKDRDDTDDVDDVGRLSDDDDDDEGVVETDVQVQLLRVGVSRPEWDAGALRWIERAAGDDVLFPVDLTFRMISQANAATGARRQGVDARVTVVSGPLRLALSPSKIATLTRVSQRLAAAVASSPARPCGVFAPVWSSYSSSSSDNGVFRDGVSGPRPAPRRGRCGDRRPPPGTPHSATASHSAGINRRRNRCSSFAIHPRSPPRRYGSSAWRCPTRRSRTASRMGSRSGDRSRPRVSSPSGSSRRRFARAIIRRRTQTA